MAGRVPPAATGLAVLGASLGSRPSILGVNYADIFCAQVCRSW